MILLTSTSDVLRVVTTTSANLQAHASWVDLDGTTVTPGRTNTAIASATTTTLVASPSGSAKRNVKTLSIRNTHASASQGVQLQHYDGTTSVDLYNITLYAGESILYVDGAGFVLLDTAGSPKAAVPTVRVATLGSDQSNSTTTPTEVTGLKLTAVGVGTYQFWYAVRYQAAATSTGVRYSVNHDGTLAWFVANARWVDASATASTAAPDQDAVGAAGQVVGAMAARAKSTAGWGTTISVDTAGADMLLIIEGAMEVTATGELELWHGSEVAAASTTKSGSNVVLIKTG